MSIRKTDWIGWAIGCGIIAGILAMLLGGCKTLKLRHEAARFDKVMAKAKVDSVVVRVDSVHTDTVTMPGELVYVDCDSVVKAALDEKSIAGYRAKTKVGYHKDIETFIFDTVWKVRDHYVENGATVSLLQKQLAGAEGSHGKMKGKRDMWRGIALVFIAVLLLDLIFRRSKTVNVRA